MQNVEGLTEKEFGLAIELVKYKTKFVPEGMLITWKLVTKRRDGDPI